MRCLILETCSLEMKSPTCGRNSAGFLLYCNQNGRAICQIILLSVVCSLFDTFMSNAEPIVRLVSRKVP